MSAGAAPGWADPGGLPQLAAQVAALTTQLNALEGQVSNLQSVNTTLARQVSGLQISVAALQANPALVLGTYITVDLNSEDGLKGPNIMFTGANLHIVSGSGNTVDSTGLGNLVIGYDEASLDPSISGNRTGSHNLVVGPQHEFTASGGLVSGYANFVNANYANVTGGECNSAGSADFFPFNCSESNVNSSEAASVSGGAFNTALGLESSVSGGESNVAAKALSSISGGDSNFANAAFSSIGGGNTNVADGLFSSVCGGGSNAASGDDSIIAGGSHNRASGDFSSVSGGDFNEASGENSSVGGGDHQTASTPDQNIN